MVGIRPWRAIKRAVYEKLLEDPSRTWDRAAFGRVFDLGTETLERLLTDLEWLGAIERFQEHAVWRMRLTKDGVAILQHQLALDRTRGMSGVRHALLGKFGPTMWRAALARRRARKRAQALQRSKRIFR